jgi:lipopolysaccharide export system permease protein
METPILEQTPLRLRIVDRYLLRELLASFLGVTTILLLIMLGMTVADVIASIARGSIPADLLFRVIGLRSIDLLAVVFPLAAFLAVLLAYGRLWRDSEMAVFQSSGLDLSGMLRPLLLLAVPLMIALGTVTFWLAPKAVRTSQYLLEEANRSLIVAGLEPGRFVELPGRDGVIYVGQMSADGTRFERMFVQTEREDEDSGAIQIDVTTATHGFLYHDADGSGRYLALNDGFRVEGRLGSDDWRLMRFGRNDVRLPDNRSETSETGVRRAVPTSALWGSDDPIQRAELQWRFAAPVSILLLVLLGLPLAKSDPREPRYARLLIAVLVYLVYANCLAIGRNAIGQERIAALPGLWWVYVPTFAIALWLIWRSQQLRGPRVARGAA